MLPELVLDLCECGGHEAHLGGCTNYDSSRLSIDLLQDSILSNVIIHFCNFQKKNKIKQINVGL